MQQCRRSLANSLLGPARQAQALLPRASLGSQVQVGQTPYVDRKPRECSGPCLCLSQDVLPPAPPPTLGSELYHIQKGFSVYYVFFSSVPHLWLINDARGVTPISLGCVIPKSDWGIVRGEVTLSRAPAMPPSPATRPPFSGHI